MRPVSQPSHAATRRQTLGLGLGALAQTTTSPAGATLSNTGQRCPDVVLIGLCDRLVALMAELDALLARQPTIADEDQPQAALDGLYDEQEQIFAALDATPPVISLRGAQALARAALVFAPHTSIASNLTTDPAEWLTVTALSYLARYA